MYLLCAAATSQWELLPTTATPPLLGDLDLLFITPEGDTIYLDAPIEVQDYIPPTPTTAGRILYKFTPELEGFWRIRLVVGIPASYQILSKIEMFVFDNSTTTTPYNDDIGKPYPYDINFFLQGFMVPNEIYGTFVASRNITLATDAPGSKAIAEEFPAFTPTTLKILHNENEIGSIVFPRYSKIGIITVTPVIILPGHKIQVVSQGASIDPNVRDIAVNLVGCCTIVACSAI